MKHTLTALCCALVFACNNDKGTASQNNAPGSSSTSEGPSPNISGHWEGSFSNGMKGARISFDISEDGKELKDLTFGGYWRCDGKLDLTTLGPEKSFVIQNNKVDGVITEPESGGASAARFELHAAINGDKAEGTFRMNINGLGCDTYKLNWTASRK